MKYKSKMELYGLSSKNVSFQAKSSRSDLYLCRGRGCPGGVLWSVGGGGSSDFFRFHFSEVLFKQSGANLVRLNHCNKDKTRLFIFPTLFRQPSITTPTPPPPPRCHQPTGSAASHSAACARRCRWLPASLSWNQSRRLLTRSALWNQRPTIMTFWSSFLLLFA